MKLKLITLTCVLLILSPLPAQSQEETNAKPILVSSVVLDKVLFHPQYSASASVISLNKSQISSQLNALIQEIHVKAGDEVKQSDILVTLDCTDAELTKAQTLANLQLSKNELNRLKKLQKAKAATEQSLNNAETQVKLTRIKYRQSVVQTQRCNVIAPFDGIVQARLSSIGELATRGTPLLTLIDTQNLEIEASLQFQQSLLLDKSSKISFVSANAEYPVQTRQLVQSIDPITRSRKLHLTFTHQKALLGSAGRIIWHDAMRKLPADLLLNREGKIGVFIVEGDQVAFIALSEAQAGHPAVIDLPENTMIVTEGRNGLSDGDWVDNKGL